MVEHITYVWDIRFYYRTSLAIVKNHNFAILTLTAIGNSNMKFFNTAGTCRPNEHYMVDITDRLKIIRKIAAKGDYFCINQGRQNGKKN